MSVWSQRSSLDPIENPNARKCLPGVIRVHISLHKWSCHGDILSLGGWGGSFCDPFAQLIVWVLTFSCSSGTGKEC